ncbi:MAG TPA: discoidin domain-containing protein [Actinokineospora sp.]|nr:discoidin domain-containing protein [Actinokineospora sp.]
MALLVGTPTRRASVLVAALAIGLVTAPSSAAAVQTTLYVSPNGSGSTCSSAAPCSLTGAQSAVRGLVPSMTGDIVVNVAGGDYPLTSTLSFGPADSGRNGYVVRWRASSGRPTLTGARTVTGWTQTTNPAVWKATVASGADFRQLYIDKTRAVRARGDFNPAGFTKTSTGYTTTTAASLATWKNPSAIEMSYRVNWTFSRCPVGSVSGTTVTMAQPCWKNAHSSPYLQNNSPRWLENARELLDAPGEWYLDKSGAVGDGANTLYYQPKPGERMTGPGAVKVTYPGLEKLVSIAGTGTSARVHDLQFIGLSFADAAFLRPNTAEGFAEEQANYTVTANGSHWIYSGFTRIPGAVDVSFANNVLIQGNLFTRLGGAALDVRRSSYNVTVLGNEVADVSGNGIQIGDITPADQRPAATADRMHDITVSNNYVHHVAVEFQGGVGIFGGYIDTLKLLHNEVSDVPYTGVSLGWGWGYHDEGGLGDGTAAGPNTSATVTTPTIAKNNQIIGNHVHHFMSAGHDGGAVYTLGAQPNSVERDNYYAQSSDWGTANGIYLDNGTQGYTVSSNVVDRVQRWLLVNEGANSLSNPAAKNNTLTGNWANTTNKQCCSSLNTVSGNTDNISGSAWPTAAQAVITAAGLETNAVDPLGQTHNWRTELHGTDSTTDLAATATTTASNYNANNATYAPGKATDGNAITRWATDSTITSANLVLTFPQATTVNRVVIKEAGQHDARVQRYTVDYWDGMQWVPTVTGAYPRPVHVDRFPAVSTTRLRLNITSSAAGPSIRSFEAYSDPAPTNLALTATATSSNTYLNNSSYNGSKATDGVITSRWATDDAVTAATLTVVFPSTRTVSSTVLRESTFYGQRIATYQVQYWTGSAWQTALTSGKPAPVQVDRFPAVSTTQIRLNITSITGTLGPTVSEFSVH